MICINIKLIPNNIRPYLLRGPNDRRTFAFRSAVLGFRLSESFTVIAYNLLPTTLNLRENKTHSLV